MMNVILPSINGSVLKGYPFAIKGLCKRFASTDPRNKPTFVRDKVNVNVCCFGESGSGKTTLTSAISWLQSQSKQATFKPTEDIDKSSEEKARGHSILPCKVEFKTKTKRFILTDLPGSKRYVKNTITGAYGSDVGIIVLNGEEGPTFQTRQHLAIARLHGIKQWIGFINQFGDEVNEIREICELAMNEMLNEEGFSSDGITYVSGSPVKALKNETTDGIESIEQLISILDSLPNPERDPEGPGRFYVDKVYSPPGRGTGVTGIVKRGKFTKSEAVDCLGLDLHFKTKINYIESFNKVQEEAIAGDAVELVLQGVKKEDVNRGMVVSSIGQCGQHNIIDVMLHLNRPVIKNLDNLVFNTASVHFESGDVTGSIISSDEILYGQSGMAQMALIRSCVLDEDQPLLLRFGDQIIGSGKVIKVVDRLSGEEIQKLIKNRKKQFRENTQS